MRSQPRGAIVEQRQTSLFASAADDPSGDLHHVTERALGGQPRPPTRMQAPLYFIETGGEGRF